MPDHHARLLYLEEESQGRVASCFGCHGYPEVTIKKGRAEFALIVGFSGK